MSTLILSTAKSAGQALINTAQNVAINYAASSVANAFDDRSFEGPKLEQFHLLTSRDGAPMARVYGRARLAGEVIWASRLKEHMTEEQVGGKGGPTQRNYDYTMSFAIGLCEGEILGVDRLWVNGQAFAASGLTLRIYKGTDNQLPDPIISAIEGATAPAFRGTAYVVFEDFPLDDYGARLPQINAEVVRVPPTRSNEPKLENKVTGVNLLPSSGEYAYATEIIEDVTGQPVPVNLNNLSGQADIEQALDQLEAQLPNCQNVSLILSWFGTDLRVGACNIRPGVEAQDRLIPDAPWKVCGETRDTAYVVSQDTGGRPHYGGTPSDASIIQAITSLKSRGFKVTIYPFILMDVPPGNDLPDPYGGPEQAAFPWRGRITSASDMTGAVTAEIDTFFGTCQPSDFGYSDGGVSYNGPSEYSFRRFILHHATLAALAGGVDRFVIGSEMRGLTTLRSGAGIYPAVSELQSLAAAVRTILGPQTGLTYAADWSEYFGHHENQDVHFHLDSLWADPNIDAVGIDAYFPLSDWRDGAHLDAQLHGSIYDMAYLASNMEGGEGYDWYYANTSDREAQIRTPITDGLASKPWIFRYKDIRNWWGNSHYDRTGGSEVLTSTAWVPQSKPIWFTEIGCPAIDKGANQPNVFLDPKSSESHTPYHSNGTRDDLIQRRYIEAFLSYWTDNNATSSIYSGPMVDMDAAHIWCWDARPFPDFPARKKVWADGVNWHVGHWLSGRTGLVPLCDVIRDIALQSGVETVDVSRVHGMIEGYVLDRPLSARAALQPLTGIYGVHMVETATGLAFISEGAEDKVSLGVRDIVHDSPGPIEEVSEDPETRPLDVRMHFINSETDYQSGMMSARNVLAETVRVVDMNVPLVMGRVQAKRLAERVLNFASHPQRRVSFNVSPARLDIEVGDVVSLPDRPGTWRIERLDGTAQKRVSASLVGDVLASNVSGSTPETALYVPWVSKPEIVVLDIPDVTGVGERKGVLVGAKVTPFNPVRISGPESEVRLDVPAAVGDLLSPLKRGVTDYWDKANGFNIHMPGIDLAAVDDLVLLSGANRFAIETDTGWEVLQARDISLIGEDTYRLEYLLRGLAGTEIDMMDVISTGARIVYLNRGLVDIPLSNSRIGENIDITAHVAGRISEPQSLTYLARHLRPLSPAHIKMFEDENGLHLSWVRRTRLGGDSWAGLDVPLGEEREFYRVEFFDGQESLAVFEVEKPAMTLPSTDWAALTQTTHINVQQGSNIWGYGVKTVREV